MTTLKNKINKLEEEVSDYEDKRAELLGKIADLKEEMESNPDQEEYLQNDIDEFETALDQLTFNTKEKIATLNRYKTLLTKGSKDHIILNEEEVKNNLTMFDLKDK